MGTRNLHTSIGPFMLLAFALRLACSPSLCAESGAPPPPPTASKSLSLADAKRLAFARNWDLLAAKSDVDIAAAQKIVSHEFPNPTLSLSTLQINLDNHPAHTSYGNGFWDRNYDSIFAINQLFEIGGKRSNRQRSAEAGLKSAQARMADARRILDLAVSRAYVAAALAEANARILLASATSLRKEAEIATVRLNAGEISQSDKSQIEIAAGRLELDAQSAEAAAKSAKIDLEVLLGEQVPTGQWTVIDGLDQLSSPPALPPTSEAAARRPDLVAAQAARDKANSDLQLQKALRIPDPTFLVQYEHQPQDQPNTLGVGVSFPLPLWNHNRGAIAAAAAARDQAALAAGKIQAQINAEITATQIAYDDALARFRRYQSELVPRSAEVLKTVSFAYQKGGASLLDLLVAERNDNDVRLASAQAAADTATAIAARQAALNVFQQNL